jgi:hypothetical protein
MKIKAALAAAVAAAGIGVAIPATAHADNMKICGPGIAAIGPTSCPFALNVAQAYFQRIGSGSGWLADVYSPTTGESYTVQCIQRGGVWCTGGNGSEVNIFR